MSTDYIRLNLPVILQGCIVAGLIFVGSSVVMLREDVRVIMDRIDNTLPIQIEANRRAIDDHEKRIRELERERR
ncbi:hypothetical protein [Alkalilimnicola ehrlichii]|uniref:Uncharacterized protein n=1 Tax=Alkalilimnicola ehrlichii TaxID=351052 RepID=A0A3E0WT23_9GAMM|nr:hypothetical protein [Alkalilimnicola ehrlichii]RFA35145.1 hypothetical protein CAL65_13650 [Alkalilimnicola ehrlichii]